MASARWPRAGSVLLLALAALLAGGSPSWAASHVTSLSVAGGQPLAGGYERVHGLARGVVDGAERVRGLPAGGLRYAVPYELIRPARRSAVALLVVEAENRGSPLLLDALTGASASGPPATAAYPASTAAFLRAERLAYGRVAWQTGIAADVPATAQGVGEVVVRDFGRALARRYPRRALAGVSQGAFLVDTLLAEGFNAGPDGRRAYQQALTVDGTGNWMAVNRLAGSGAQDPYLRANGRPLGYRELLRRPSSDPVLVDVANYTDFYRLRAGLTDVAAPPAGVHRYDVPSPHQSFAPGVVFGGFGCNGGVPVPLNPLEDGPYLRALVRGLRRGHLPSSRRFALGGAPRASAGFNALPGVAVRVPRVDRDGQPVGGVRFPDLDLPLGRLAPVALSPAVTTSSAAVCGNSGGYQPFTPAEVARRHGRAAYLAQYARAVAGLVRTGYLRGADRAGVVAAAGRRYDAALGAGS